MGALAALFAVTGCVLPLDIDIHDGWGEVRGNGHVVSASRGVAPFDAIVADGAVRVVVERTGREGVTVTAEDNLLPYLESEVRGGVLYLGPVAGASLSPRREIVFRVESYEVLEIEGSGASALEVEVGWVPEFRVRLSGASTATVWGEADVQHGVLSGASRYDALDLDSFRAGLSLSGASRAMVWARDRLDVEASGASQVRFTGDPWVSARVSGASSVTRY
jgi:hypothetical protein